MINRSQIRFHETFQPERGYISKILELASSNYVGNKFDISEKTGIPTGKQKGKVEPHIKYAAFMGLITYKCMKGNYYLSLTELGEEVFSQDMYLHEALSKWICHYGISCRDTGAPQWAFLINEAHPGFIQPLSFERLMSCAAIAFDTNITFDDAFAVIKRSYSDGMFADLEFLETDTNEFKFIESFPKDELLYVYAYAILNNWDRSSSDKNEITLNELIDTLSFGKQFGLSDDSVNEVLEELSEEELFSVNRQLFPPTIIRTSTKEDILPLLYSRLM